MGKERPRSEVVKLALSWLGKNEADGSYKKIIDIYNSFTGPLPRGLKMQYNWPWCACMWSSLAISLGYTDIMPIEISCGDLIKKAEKMDCWEENDGYVPSPGDAILYDWQDNGTKDNHGWPDHIGVVERCDTNSGYITAIEGNYDDSVKKRTISINGKYIRGFIVPAYTEIGDLSNISGTSKDIKTVALEVISGLWGNGKKRKESLEKCGLNYSEVQAKVNEILNTPPSSIKDKTFGVVATTCYARNKSRELSGKYVTKANLYCRNDAGTNKKALCLIPEGTTVCNYGYYTVNNGVKWLLIQAEVNNVLYTGFSSSVYLKKK